MSQCDEGVRRIQRGLALPGGWAAADQPDGWSGLLDGGKKMIFSAGKEEAGPAKLTEASENRGNQPKLS